MTVGRQTAALCNLLGAALLAACASKPPVPDWQLQAKSASERFVQAFLSGERSATAELDRARLAVSSTGQAALLARLELLRCASEVAALVLQPCPGFEALRQDAPPAERAYADYLAGRLAPSDAPLLPPAQRRVAEQGAGALASVDEPLARLVAAGVLLRSGRASPETLEQAVATASAQGWRRALLAWLGAQALRAEQAGDAVQASQLRRRMALVEGRANRPATAPTVPAASADTPAAPQALPAPAPRAAP